MGCTLAIGGQSALHFEMPKIPKCRFLAHLGVQHVTNKQRAAPLTFLPCTVDTHAYPVVDGAYVAVVLKVWKKCLKLMGTSSITREPDI